MPISGSININFDGQELPEVAISFGVDCPKQRRRSLQEGWGFSIELPAVLDMLTAVEAGTVNAAKAREALLQIPRAVYDRWDLRREESPTDLYTWCQRDRGCPDCERHRKAFDRALTTWQEQFRRFQQPETYPFAAGSAKGLHEVTCPVPRRSVPREWVRPEGERYTGALRAFSHTADFPPFEYETLDKDDQAALDEVRIGWTAMTAEETRAWAEKNTGPKGGRRYHRCRRCSATP